MPQSRRPRSVCKHIRSAVSGGFMSSQVHPYTHRGREWFHDSPCFIIPFLFHGQEPVLQWYSSLRSNTEVCAIGFVDSTRVKYQLRTFPDPDSALKENYVITHRHHCGTCSSLRDLMVYQAKSDLTTPARKCARRLTAGGIKACLMEEVGLGEHCAET